MTISGPVLLLAALAAAPDAALRAPADAAAQLAPRFTLAQAFQSLPVVSDAFRDGATAATPPVQLGPQHRRRPGPFPIRYPAVRKASAIAAGAFVGFLAGAFGTGIAGCHLGVHPTHALWVGGSAGAVTGGWLAWKHSR